jgi:hypothetical protein
VCVAATCELVWRWKLSLSSWHQTVTINKLLFTFNSSRHLLAGNGSLLIDVSCCSTNRIHTYV